ncbi:unnamed protein product, partial [Rotaria sp. Silwood2]
CNQDHTPYQQVKLQVIKLDECYITQSHNHMLIVVETSTANLPIVTNTKTIRCPRHSSTIAATQ